MDAGTNSCLEAAHEGGPRQLASSPYLPRRRSQLLTRGEGDHLPQGVGFGAVAAAAGIGTGGLGWGLAGALSGISRAVILRPSIDGGRSTLPRSASFSSTWSSTRRPSCWCCISRPRNWTVTWTLSPCSRNLRAWPTFVSTSWSPVLGRTRISFSFCWRALAAPPAFCACSYFIFP